MSDEVDISLFPDRDSFPYMLIVGSDKEIYTTLCLSKYPTMGGMISILDRLDRQILSDFPDIGHELVQDTLSAYIIKRTEEEDVFAASIIKEPVRRKF